MSVDIELRDVEIKLWPSLALLAAVTVAIAFLWWVWMVTA